MFKNKVTSKYPESVKKIIVKYLALKMGFLETITNI